VIVVKGTGIKAILPQVPASFISSVETLGIETVNPAQGFGKVVCRIRNHDEMNMVIHEAVGKNSSSCPFEPFCEEREVFLPVCICQEDILSIVPPLCDMKRDSRHDDACEARHSSIAFFLEFDPPGEVSSGNK